jgi:apolipoprotein D and lipocalin family protein
VRIEQREGGIRDGGRVTVSIGLGSARLHWSMRHYGYIDGRRFCDEQAAGPFAVWRHAHLFESLGPSQTLYEDRIEFAVTRRRALNRVAAAVLRPLLLIAFAHRHRVVATAIGHARPRVVARWAAAAVLAAATMVQPAAGSAQTAQPVRTVPLVDLDRYAGDWFEIARFPNRFQRQCVSDVRASYARRADGRVDVVNRCRTADGESEARGVARVVDERTFTKLQVRFAPAWLSWLPMVWGDYWIIGLAPDYSWAVVGDPGRDYLWILARAPQLEDASTAAARAAARDNGFDVTRLVPTSQAGPPLSRGRRFAASPSEEGHAEHHQAKTKQRLNRPLVERVQHQSGHCCHKQRRHKGVANDAVGPRHVRPFSSETEQREAGDHVKDDAGEQRVPKQFLVGA